VGSHLGVGIVFGYSSSIERVDELEYIDTIFKFFVDVVNVKNWTFRAITTSEMIVAPFGEGLQKQE